MSFTLRGDQRVLVRIPAWVGDAVMAEPVLAALHAHHDRAGRAGNLSFAGPKRLLELFEGRLEGARRLPCSGPRGDRPADWRGHDIALLLTGSLRTAWCALLAGIPMRAGWARDGRGALLTHGARPARERGGVPLLLGRHGRPPRILPRPFGAACVELAGLIGLSVARTRPLLIASGRGAGAARARLASLGLPASTPFVLACASGRPGSAKAYPPELWGRALEELAQRTGVAIVLAGAPGEEADLAQVLGGMRPGAALACAAPQPDLGELLSLCAAARLVLCTDGGARHIAMAAGAPLIAVAGPTDPRHTADHLRAQRVLRSEVPCGPCHRERCPLSGAEHHACMRAVAPQALVEAAASLLKAGAG